MVQEYLSWGWDDRRPALRSVTDGDGAAAFVHASHPVLGDYWLACDRSPSLLFTENETNAERLWGGQNPTPFVKDGIDSAVVHGRGIS